MKTWTRLLLIINGQSFRISRKFSFLPFIESLITFQSGFGTPLHERLGYSVFLYQRVDPKKPHYIRNRGTEAGVYLRYIVDHYDNFPDVAIFVHAFPHHHQVVWLEHIGCISPNATYMNFNFAYYNRSSDFW